MRWKSQPGGVVEFLCFVVDDGRIVERSRSSIRGEAVDKSDRRKTLVDKKSPTSEDEVTEQV